MTHDEIVVIKGEDYIPPEEAYAYLYGFEFLNQAHISNLFDVCAKAFNAKDSDTRIREAGTALDRGLNHLFRHKNYFYDDEVKDNNLRLEVKINKIKENVDLNRIKNVDKLIGDCHYIRKLSNKTKHEDPYPLIDSSFADDEVGDVIGKLAEVMYCIVDECGQYYDFDLALICGYREAKH